MGSASWNYMQSLCKKRLPFIDHTQTEQKGQARCHMKKAWILHEPTKTFLEIHLLIRKDSDGRTKYVRGLHWRNQYQAEVSRVTEILKAPTFFHRPRSRLKGIQFFG